MKMCQLFKGSNKCDLLRKKICKFGHHIILLLYSIIKKICDLSQRKYSYAVILTYAHVCKFTFKYTNVPTNGVFIVFDLAGEIVRGHEIIADYFCVC